MRHNCWYFTLLLLNMIHHNLIELWFELFTFRNYYTVNNGMFIDKISKISCSKQTKFSNILLCELAIKQYVWISNIRYFKNFTRKEIQFLDQTKNLKLYIVGFDYLLVLSSAFSQPRSIISILDYIHRI